MHPHTGLVEHMGVNHRRAHIFVPQQLLHGSNVVAVLKEMGGERVPESCDSLPPCARQLPESPA